MASNLAWIACPTCMDHCLRMLGSVWTPAALFANPQCLVPLFSQKPVMGAPSQSKRKSTATVLTPLVSYNSYCKSVLERSKVTHQCQGGGDVSCGGSGKWGIGGGDDDQRWSTETINHQLEHVGNQNDARAMQQRSLTTMCKHLPETQRPLAFSPF